MKYKNDKKMFSLADQMYMANLQLTINIQQYTMNNIDFQHYMKVHAEKTFCCETCGVKFGLRADLKRHMTLSHGIKGKQPVSKKKSVTCSGQQVCDR